MRRVPGAQGLGLKPWPQALVTHSESPGAVQVMGRLAALLMLSEMDAAMGDFLEDGHLSASQAKLVRLSINALLTELRPEAVALVDAFNLDDYFLNSVLGSADGDVYGRLFTYALGVPFNASVTGPGFAELIAPKANAFAAPRTRTHAFHLRPPGHDLCAAPTLLLGQVTKGFGKSKL